MTTTHPELLGICADRFLSVREVLEENLRAGEELGASLVLNVNGETLIDLYGGFRDAARTMPWARDTIANVFSTTKTITNLATLMLADRGELDVFAPVANYWPEFAANGKREIEVRHVMAHTSGVSGWDQPFAHDDLYDWQKATQRLAGQAPWWKPGSASGYHGRSQGYLLGELIRRITGMTPRQFIAAEIAGPLHADYQIGAHEKDWHRVSELVMPPPLPFDLESQSPDSPMVKTLTGPPAIPDAANTPAWRRAEIPGSNGHGNARSVARIMSAVTLGGEVEGVRLLRPDTIDLIFQEQSNGIDLVLGIPLRWGIGLGLPQPDTMPVIPDEGRICYWGGWGGSMIVMDLNRGMTISYVMNKMAPGIIGSERSAQYIKAIYGSI